MKQSSSGQEPNETIAVVVPESQSKSSNPVLRFLGHPYPGVEVSDNELVEGLLAKGHFLQPLVERVDFELISC